MTFLVNEHNRPEEYRTVYKRSFFGTMKIEPYRRGVAATRERSPEFVHLVHGTTVHGMQHRDPDGVSIAAALGPLGASGPADALGLAWIAEPHYRFPGREPLTYYHRSGPVGLMFQAFWDQVDGTNRNKDVAAIGLGTGSLSSYARPNETMTFFEIDKTVVELVDRKVDEEDGPFTYMKRAKQQGAKIELLLGDARLTLEQTDRKWGFMLVDAFSSDSIPAHLLTKEAVKLYFDRLEDDGLLALHISNRYLKLEPVVDQIVRDPDLKLEAIVMHDYLLENYNDDLVEFSGKLASTWVLVAKRRESFGPLLNDPRWVGLKQDESVGLWTDDYTPVTRALSGGWWNLFSK